MESIKYATLLDFILRLCKDVREKHPLKYLSLTSALRLFKHSMSFNEIVEIGKYFETRGWAKSVYVLGDVRIQIQTEGVVYIEDKGADFEKDYAEFIRKLITDNQEDFYVRLTDEETDPRSVVIDLITELAKKISEKEGLKTDYVKDLDIIKTELSKTKPDYRLIMVKVNNLTDITYALSEIQELKNYLSNFDSF